jgi:hypothetical protein
MKEQIVSRIKDKKTWIPIMIGLFALGICYSLGYNQATVEINEKKLNHDQLEKVIAENKDEIKSLEEFILSTTNRYEEVSNELESAKETIASSASAKKELESLTSSINSKKDEILSLDKELNSLQGKIEESGAKSINLPAGHFTVGKDITAGRYKIIASGRGGNLMIDDALGDMVVLTSIYSNKDYGETEYVIELGNNYFIEAQASFEYIPVK